MRSASWLLLALVVILWIQLSHSAALLDRRDDEEAGNGEGEEEQEALLTYQEFQDAILSCYPDVPLTEKKYQGFLQALKAADICHRMEAAFFLTQVLWESGGLAHKREIACKETCCKDQYRHPGDAPDKFYYGRGYIQLTWSYNYKACSEALFGDDRLLQQPDLVAKEKNAWLSAAWFWKTVVKPKLADNPSHFGLTTQYINGALECKRKGVPGPHIDKAKKRYKNLRTICEVLGIKGVKPDGCYKGEMPPEFCN